MTAMVNADDRKMLRQFFVCREELRITRSSPTVQQQQCWCRSVGVLMMADEHFATTWNVDDFSW
jgi:hypothetical protein